MQQTKRNIRTTTHPPMRVTININRPDPQAAPPFRGFRKEDVPVVLSSLRRHIEEHPPEDYVGCSTEPEQLASYLLVARDLYRRYPEAVAAPQVTEFDLELEEIASRT